MRCKNCKGRSFADLQVCPHCGRNRAAAADRTGRIAALILVILAAAVVGFMLFKSDRQPNDDPAPPAPHSTFPTGEKPKRSSEPEGISFK